MKVIICRGIPGSGKSTWAKQWVLEDPKHRIRINYDDIRLMIGGGIEGYWIPARENANFTGVARDVLLKRAASTGYDVVMDNMNLNPKETTLICAALDEMKKLLPNFDYSIEYRDFKTPVEECIARDAKRERPIGEATIRGIYNRNKAFYGE